MGDRSGTITAEEFKEHLGGKKEQEFLATLHISPQIMSKIFELIDTSGDGNVDVEEFVSACQNFQGWAKNIDMAVAMERIGSLASLQKGYLDYVLARDSMFHGPVRGGRKATSSDSL